MNEPPAILSLVTLGVADLDRSIGFYETLGFQRKAHATEGVGFFKAGACVISVFPLAELAKDANLALEGIAGTFRGVTLAWNCNSQDHVDAAFKRAQGAGAVIIKSPQKVFWGGYSGYFADPDGHLWEVAYNPFFPLDDAGRLTLPE